MVFGKIKKLLDTFKENKLKQANKNLVRGLFKRKIKDFDEEYKAKNKNMTLLERLKQGGPLFESDEEQEEEQKSLKQDQEEQKNQSKGQIVESGEMPSQQEIPFEDEKLSYYVKQHRRNFSNQNIQNKYEKMSDKKKRNILSKDYAEDSNLLERQ